MYIYIIPYIYIYIIPYIYIQLCNSLYDILQCLSLSTISNEEQQLMVGPAPQQATGPSWLQVSTVSYLPIINGQVAQTAFLITNYYILIDLFLISSCKESHGIYGPYSSIMFLLWLRKPIIYFQKATESDDCDIESTSTEGEPAGHRHPPSTTADGALTDSAYRASIYSSRVRGRQRITTTQQEASSHLLYPAGQMHDDSKICPMCNQIFTKDVTQDMFENHVVAHFEDIDVSFEVVQRMESVRCFIFFS